MAMPQDGAPPAMSPDAPAQPGPSEDASASDRVQRISSDMTWLLQQMDRAKGFPPDAKSQLAQMLQQFQGYAENVLMSSANAKPSPEQPPMNPGPAPMESGGNPNARPM